MNLVQIQYTCILVRTTQYIKVQVNISSLQLQGHRAPRRRRQRRDLRLRPRRRQHSAVSRARLLSKYRGLQCAPHATATAELVALLLTSAAQEKKGGKSLPDEQTSWKLGHQVEIHMLNHWRSSAHFQLLEFRHLWGFQGFFIFCKEICCDDGLDIPIKQLY